MFANPQDPFATQADAEDTQGVRQIRASRGVQDDALFQPPQKNRKRQVENDWEKEGQPKPNIFLSVRRRDLHEASDVDEKVEPEHDTL